MNDVIGTDPIALGGGLIKDIKNKNFDNTKRTIKNVKNSWDESLTKQAFTDPKGAGKRVKKDIKKTADNVKKGFKNAGDKVKGFFSKKKKKKR